MYNNRDSCNYQIVSRTLKNKCCNRAPRSCVYRLYLKSLSPTTAADKVAEHKWDLKKPHHQAVLRRVEVDTNPEGQDEAIDGRPWTGVTPQAL
jgi:hypothetical protein